jgi:hypothetical protein
MSDYCRSCCYRRKINCRYNDTGDKHKVTNNSANFLKKFKWYHEDSGAEGKLIGEKKLEIENLVPDSLYRLDLGIINEQLFAGFFDILFLNRGKSLLKRSSSFSLLPLADFLQCRACIGFRTKIMGSPSVTLSASTECNAS